jgi:PII-like signaling protein
VLAPGPAKKVTIHLNVDTSSRDDFLSNEILSLLFAHGIAGATVTRPDAGFGSHHRMHSQSGGIDFDQHMPIRIEFIESQAKVEELLPSLENLLIDGVIEAHDTTILKAAMADKPRHQGGSRLR